MLEVDTPEGMDRIKTESQISTAVCMHFGWIDLTTGRTAPIDRVFHSGLDVVAVGEIKSRDCTSKQIYSWGSGIISATKLEHGRAASVALNVPYWVFLGCIDGVILAWEIFTTTGEPRFSYTTERMQTQRSVSNRDSTKIDSCVHLPARHSTQIHWTSSRRK